MKLQLTCFENFTSRFDIEPGRHKRNICQVEYLRTVWKREGPQLWRWPQNVHESFSIARAHFRAVWHANKVRVPVDPEFVVELFAGGDEQRLHELASLRSKHWSACGHELHYTEDIPSI